MSSPSSPVSSAGRGRSRSQASILEGHKTIRELWVWAVEEVKSMIREIRTMSASGQRFLALAKLLREQAAAKRDGSFKLALAATKRSDEDSDPRTMSLMSAVKKIVQRTDVGKRNDEQCDLILKAFPIISQISGSKSLCFGICQQLRFKTIKPQDVVVEQGDLGKSFYALLGGSVRVIIRPKDSALHDKIADHGSVISVLKPGDLLLRRLRFISYFETFAFAVVGRDMVDDIMCEVAYINEEEYNHLLIEERLAMSKAVGERALERRRSNLLGARNALKRGDPKKTTNPTKKRLKGLLSKAAKTHSKMKRKAEGRMTVTDAINFVISEKDKIRITMAKAPERRTVEELEFVIEFLERCGFWEKVADVKSGDEGKGRKAEGGGVINLANDDGDGKIAADRSASGLTPRLQREIVRQLRTLVYGKKELVFEEGALGTYFFYILTGSVMVRKREGNIVKTLCTLGTGSCFGELALSKMGNGRRTASIVTRELCEFLVLPKSLYLKCIESFQEKHMAHRVELLRESSIFSDRPWGLRDLKSLCYPLEEAEYGMNKMICRQGRFANHIYFIKRGECNVFKNIKVDDDMVTMSLGRLSRGDAFGLMGAGGETYLQNMRYSVSVVSSTPVTLMTLTRYDVFNRILPAVKDELQAQALNQKWNSEEALLKRLVNRQRFVNFRKYRLDSILPEKYRSRQDKAIHDAAMKKVKISSTKRQRQKRREKRLAKEGSRLPKVKTHLEQHIPPSRQCTRRAMLLAAELGPKVSISSTSSLGNTSPHYSSTDDLVGAGMLPVSKPLMLPEGVLSQKIQKWTRNQTGANVKVGSHMTKRK